MRRYLCAYIFCVCIERLSVESFFYVGILCSLALEPTSQFVLHSVFFSDMRQRGRRSAEERGFACLSVATCGSGGHVSRLKNAVLPA